MRDHVRSDEPGAPAASAGDPAAAATDTRIVRAAIHPAIGVARLGNSADGFFIGPQVVPIASGAARRSYRDARRALKREAAQFRHLRLQRGRRGRVRADRGVRRHRWTVHVANTKAGWYQWEMAMDVPEAAAIQLPLRNASVAGSCAIDAGHRCRAATIAGKSTGGSSVRVARRLHRGRTSIWASCGPTRTAGWCSWRDAACRRRRPAARSSTRPIRTVHQRRRWYDDICDGPVTAEVRIEGREIPVEPAWVVERAAELRARLSSARTLYDLLVDLYVAAGGWPRRRSRPSARDVYPILRRLSGLQWVNQGFATQFGRGGPHDFEDPDTSRGSRASRRGRRSTSRAELRHQVLKPFRSRRSRPTAISCPGRGSTATRWTSRRGRRARTPRSADAIPRVGSVGGGQFVADWDQPSTPPASIETSRCPAAGDARPRRAGVLPRRRVPSRAARSPGRCGT